MGVWSLVPARVPDRQVAIGVGVVEQPGYGLFIFKFSKFQICLSRLSYQKKIIWSQDFQNHPFSAD